jgi:hypothetical protein
MSIIEEIESAAIIIDAKRILEHRYDGPHKTKPYPIDRMIICSESDPIVIAESLSREIGADIYHLGMNLQKITVEDLKAVKTDKPLIITVYDIDVTNFNTWVRYATCTIEGCVVIYKKFF